jgi:hypothetical protein
MSAVSDKDVTPVYPSSMMDDELVRAAEFYLHQNISLPIAWQLELIKRLESALRRR